MTLLNVCCNYFSAGTTTIKHKMAGIIVSPLNAALYGSDIVVNDNTMKIYKPEPIDTEIQNENVFRNLLKMLGSEVDNRNDYESGDTLYDTIKSNVISCKMFSSRYVGRCYITNKHYGDNIKGCVFNGAKDVLGERWYFSGFPYHMSSEHLLPIAELMFNMSEYIVPLIDFPNIDKEREHIFVNVKRSNGVIQRGIIKSNPCSMVIYRVYDGKRCVHPSYAPDSPIVPYITVHFKSNYVDVEEENPLTDSSKGLFLSEIIEQNPDLSEMFRIGDELIPTFETAFHHSMEKYNK